jgi:CRISPR-associated endonuclease Cas1
MAASQERIREVERDHGTVPTVLRRRGNVLVVDGFGASLQVERGRLIVLDGAGRERRERSFSRAGRSIARVVVLGGTGSISLGALRWLADQGIPLLALDRESRLLCVSVPPSSGDARLRRAQALAATNEVGLGVARYLLGEKLRGQRDVLLGLDPREELLGAFDGAFGWLGEAGDTNELVMAERDGALAYWTGWRGVEIRFRNSDGSSLPDHWRSFGRRISPLSAAPRLATNPINAILNYLYAILEAETRVACLTVGLDPTLGIVHADFRSRDSLALDVMEAIRPRVDAYVLQLFERRTFSANDFFETRKGVCRLLRPLTHELAGTAPVWAELIAPVCEQVARMLSEAPGSKVKRVLTPLAHSNHAEARDAVRRRPPRSQLCLSLPEKVCKNCGGELPRRERVYCDACYAQLDFQTKKRCKGCGGKVPNRHRVYCDECYAD